MPFTFRNGFALRTPARTMIASALFLALVLGGVAGCGSATSPTGSNAPRPAVGDSAPNFELADLEGRRLSLTSLREAGPVVLVVLRGFPGYQCPVCQGQAARFLAASDQLREHAGSVVLVYPGPAADVHHHARAFLAADQLPDSFYLAVDPEYRMVYSYGLRRHDPGETAHPATFVIGADAQILFAKALDTDGGRATPDEVLRVLAGE